MMQMRLPLPRVRLITLSLVVAAMLAAMAHDLVKLLESYPTGYVWSELLINYSGGFVRRGAFGEAILRLSPWVSPRLSVSVALSALYLGFIALSVRFFRRLDLALILLFLLSPGLYAFWIWDWGVFGRKEILSMVPFLGLACMAQSLPSGVPGTGALLRRYACLNAVLALCCLAHELVVFFVPFFLILVRQLSPAGNRRLELALQFASLITVPFLVFLTMFACRAEGTAPAIAASWEALFPGFKFAPDAGALRFFAMTMPEGIAISVNVMRTAPTNWQYLVLAVFAVLPVGYVYLLGRSGLARYAAESAWNKALLLGCLMLPLILFVIGMDYGRWINQIVFHWYVMLAVFAARDGLARPEDDSNEEVSLGCGLSVPRRRYALAGILLALTLSCVGMRHFVTAGDSPIAWLPIRALF